MSIAQFLVTAVISILVTLPAVLFIPRARQSPVFDRVLWAGTALLAFLSAWFVLGNLSANLSSLNGWVLGEVAVIPALIGAAVGAFALNGLLWLMDSSSRGSMEEDLELSGTQNSAATIAGEEDNTEEGSTYSSGQE